MRYFTLRLYYLSLEALRACAPVFDEIARHDPDLARQGRRAGASMHLNIAEGMESQGKLRTSRYRNALASCDETIAALEIGEALKYIRRPEHALAKLQHVHATTLKMLKARR